MRTTSNPRLAGIADLQVFKCGIRQLRKDFSVFDRNGKRLLSNIFGEAVPTSRCIILPAVPWAGHDATVELAVTDRSACMGAYSVDGVKRAVDIEQSYNPPARCDFES